MITIKNKIAFQKMKQAGQLLALLFQELNIFIQPGLSTFEIEQYIALYLKKYGLVSCMKGYRGYPYVSCISLNDEVVHGMPKSTTIIADGDLVKVDVCASFKEYCADMARCFFIGTPDIQAPDIQKLILVAYAALDKGIEQALVGNRLSDISFAIQQCVEAAHCGIVRDFAGHGIGKKMHEDPEIVNFGLPGKGPVLRHGMSFALEPMITLGNGAVYTDADGWTVKTKDKTYAAHVEDTILITDEGPQIITRLKV